MKTMVFETLLIMLILSMILELLCDLGGLGERAIGLRAV
jgi:hypothetical protein